MSNTNLVIRNAEIIWRNFRGEGTDYNNAATDYNATIKKFPNVIFAGIFGFEKSELFEASSESQTVPTVNFD